MLKTLKFLLLALVAYLGAPSDGGAALAYRYVVGTGGATTGACPTGTPCTLTYAQSLAAPGTDVIFRAGTYTGRWAFTTSGTANNWIRYYAYPGEVPVLDNARVYPGDLLDVSANYIEISGLEIKNSGGAGIDLDGNGTAHHDFRLIGNNIHDNWQNGVVAFSNTSNVWIEGNDIHDNGQVNAPPNTGTVFWPGILQCEGSGGLGTNFTAINNLVHNNWGEGINIGSCQNVVIKANRVWDNWSVNIYPHASTNVTIDANLVWNTGDPQRASCGFGFAVGSCGGAAQQPACIETTIEGGETKGIPNYNHTIINNICVGASFGYYYLDGSSPTGLIDATIANNTFVNCAVYCIKIQSSTDHSGDYFYNNIMYSSTSGPLAYNQALIGWTFGNNLWFGDSGAHNNYGSGSDVAADPLFENPALRNPLGFRLKPGSPALYAGIVVPKAAYNFWGARREIGGNNNIGAD